jgi:hypothetical protein
MKRFANVKDVAIEGSLSCLNLSTSGLAKVQMDSAYYCRLQKYVITDQKNYSSLLNAFFPFYDAEIFF